VLPLDGKLLAHLVRARVRVRVRVRIGVRDRLGLGFGFGLALGLGFGFGFGFGLASCSRTLRRCWPTAGGEILVVYVLGFGLGRYGLSGEPPG